MVKENHFRFDHKIFFNFLKIIYGFKNRKSFFEIKLFVLAYTFNIRLLESSNDQSSESGNIRPPENCRRTIFRPDLTGSGGVRLESGNGDSCIFSFL